jgi:hypothetical protein
MAANSSSQRLPRIPHTLGALVVMIFAGWFGCGHSRTEGRRLPAWVFESSRAENPSGTRRSAPRRPRPRGGISGRSEAADLVVSALQSNGLRFGTDGSVASLWGYLKNSYSTVVPSEVRPGDVLFFETQAAPEEGCDPPNHVALVSAVDDRRIAFIESRDGRVRQSYADFGRPWLRRDDNGRVLNTFLRPKKIGDPADTPTFAGEMVCAAIRPEH